MKRTIIPAILGSLLLSTFAVHAEQPRSPHPFVVIVGVSQFADKQIQPRPNAENDAKALYDLFTNKDYSNAGKENVKLLLGTEDRTRQSEPATKENILKALNWLQKNALVDDLVVLVFVGQAGSITPQGERICYFASDSTVKDRAKNSVLASEISAELDKLKSQNFCVLLDVNFKGFTPEKGTAPEPAFGEDDGFKEFLGHAPKDQPTPPGRVLFLSSSTKYPMPDGKDLGIFTEVVLEALKGNADKDGYEPDGSVTVDELIKYVVKGTTDKLRDLKVPEDKRPFPGVFGGSATHFGLTTNPVAYKEVKQRLEKLAELAKANKINEKRAEEGKELLGRMPKLDSQKNLRKAYQQLVDGKITVDQFETERDSIAVKTKLKRTEAIRFATTVVEGAQKLKENYVKDLTLGELVATSIKGLHRRLEEKIPQDIVDEMANIKDMKEAELVDLLMKVRERLGVREDLSEHKDIDIALQRMTTNLDPYTTYWDPKTVDAMRKDVSGKFRGVGIQIRKDFDSDMLRVVSPLRGSPAYRAKIMAGDIVTGVTNFYSKEGKKLPTPETKSTKGMPLNEAVELILGLPKTEVKLTIQREGEDKPLDFTLTRETINVESVLGVKRKDDDSWDYWLDPTSKIGYLRLTSFQENSAEDMKDIVKDLSKNGLKGLVLDLRNNPGGLLSSAADISDLFISDGLIVSIRKRGAKPENMTGQKAGSFTDFPLVCMVNGNSASGSEIVSACLQDHNRAIILGERSYGKGSVQNILPFDGGALKFTTATFWRPNNKNLNKASTSGKEDEDWGVRPNTGYEVKMTREEQDALAEHQQDVTIIPRRDKPAKNPKPEFKDRQLDKALDYLHEQIKTASRGSEKKGT